MLEKAQPFLSYREHRKSINCKDLHCERKKKVNSISTEIASSVRYFLEQDENSQMCSGKKDHKTKNKVKIQKRLLLDTLKNLHQKYIRSHNIKLSYSSFCRLRPFWVVEPTLSDRNTCACIKHANMERLVKKLYQLKILDIKTPREICKSLCCNIQFKECMYRKCRVCKDRELNIMRTTDQQEERISVFQ